MTDWKKEASDLATDILTTAITGNIPYDSAVLSQYIEALCRKAWNEAIDAAAEVAEKKQTGVGAAFNIRLDLKHKEPEK